MPNLPVTVEIPASASRVYQYLRNRYNSETFRNASLAARGYLAEIHRVEEQENRKLRFWVAARDTLLRFRISGWRWEYALEAIDEGKTRVTITYRWGIFLSFITLWTARHQAGSELLETVMALEALAQPPG
jgi:hypothetical protein